MKRDESVHSDEEIVGILKLSERFGEGAVDGIGDLGLAREKACNRDHLAVRQQRKLARLRNLFSEEI